MFTEAAARFLLTLPGQELLTEADALHAARTETLRALVTLRRQADPQNAAAAWETAQLRARAVPKFGAGAAQMLLTREALEQASGRGASDFHALRFREAGVPHVYDLTGGIGGDALAFARVGLKVTVYEQDPVRALFAAHNAQVSRFSHAITVVHGNAEDAPLQPGDAVWLDPARRDNGRRVSGPGDYLPPLSFLRSLAARDVTDVGVKAAPAIDHAAIAAYGAEAEWLSEGGECKEALLWLGKLRRGDGLTRAALLTADGPQTLAGLPDDVTVPAGQPVADTDALAAVRFLYEPDPAVIRAHLVGTLAGQLEAVTVDPHIAYLVSPTLSRTPFARAYAVLEQFPYARKRLQAALSERNVGRVVIKKRGFPLEPDAVRAQLKLKGDAEATVILTRQGDAHRAFVCEPAGNAPARVQQPFP